MNDYSLTPEAGTLICTELQKAVPNALGIYAFGSRVQGTANAQSDLDLAVLVAAYGRKTTKLIYSTYRSRKKNGIWMNFALSKSKKFIQLELFMESKIRAFINFANSF